jgi:hypothetical protein
MNPPIDARAVVVTSASLGVLLSTVVVLAQHAQSPHHAAWITLVSLALLTITPWIARRTSGGARLQIPYAMLGASTVLAFDTWRVFRWPITATEPPWSPQPLVVGVLIATAGGGLLAYRMSRPRPWRISPRLVFGVVVLVGAAVPFGYVRSRAGVEPAMYFSGLSLVARVATAIEEPTMEMHGVALETRATRAQDWDLASTRLDVLGARRWGLANMRTNCWSRSSASRVCSVSYRGGELLSPDGIERTFERAHALEVRRDRALGLLLFIGGREGVAAWNDLTHRWVELRASDHPGRFAPGMWCVGAAFVGCVVALRMAWVARRRRHFASLGPQWRDATLHDEGLIVFDDGTSARVSGGEKLRVGDVVVTSVQARTTVPYRGEVTLDAADVHPGCREDLVAAHHHAADDAAALGLAWVVLLGMPLVVAVVALRA